MLGFGERTYAEIPGFYPFDVARSWRSFLVEDIVKALGMADNVANS